ncbi:MAG TPA: sigma-70 family RNA polymerase sigma factor [Candidatus Saccharimonadia bacterium]|nr:sigma-70 family RNA polymerase sigma factor [Candidatus Saccharimonadia bacterium]
MSDEQDAALVRDCLAGSTRAFEELLARYQRPVYNAAFRILNNREDAKDVTQAVFLSAYEHLAQFDASQRFFSWIYRIAANKTLDSAAARKPLEPLSEGLVEAGPGPREVAMRGQLDAGLQDALMALKLEYRTVIVLKHVQGCSYEEIGMILECPVKTVKSRLHTARVALRDVLVARGLV